MTPKLLAAQLRQRPRTIAHLRKMGIADPETLLAQQSDETIVLSFITCPNCGEQWLTGKRLDTAIAQSETDDEFLDHLPRHGPVERVAALRHAALVQQNRQMFEDAALEEYFDDFGPEAPQPGDVRAINIRSDCGTYWQAVELTNCNGRLAFYEIVWQGTIDSDEWLLESRTANDLEELGLQTA